jgi:hypothetical protein
MSNKRITDLTELTTPTTDDVFPVVDIATNTTTKVQLANLPVQTAVTTALATKQDTLVSGTNIKTVNSTSLVGSGNVAVQPTLVSGTSIKTVNSNSLLGAGDVAVQPTLVSGTNIKTLNSVSLLGAGDIVLAATPSGVSGAIQFSNGSAFASDAANLFWDDTNNRLGVGTNNPQDRCEVNGNIRLSASAFVYSSAAGGAVTSGLFLDSSTSKVSVYTNSAERVIFGASTVATIKGSGSTSATTSLLVQNSSAFTSLKTLDNGEVLMYPSTTYPTDISFRSYQSGGLAVVGLISDRLTISGGGAQDTYIQGYGTFLHYQQFRGLVINNLSSATLSTTPSALVEIQSTTQGFLPPKMTTTQKNAIASPASGLILYDSTTNKLQCYNGSTWNDLF